MNQVSFPNPLAYFLSEAENLSSLGQPCGVFWAVWLTEWGMVIGSTDKWAEPKARAKVTPMILNPNRLKIENLKLKTRSKACSGWQQPDAEENIFALPNRGRGYVMFIGDLNKWAVQKGTHALRGASSGKGCKCSGDTQRSYIGETIGRTPIWSVWEDSSAFEREV